MTVLGIGKLNGIMILSEISDIHRFSHPSKLLAYAGLDLIMNQSGKFMLSERFHAALMSV